MAFDLKTLKQARIENVQAWENREAIIYALATGYGQDGINDDNLMYFYERDLIVVPSFATVLARNAAPSVAEFGGDYSKSVLASVRAEFHTALPCAGKVTATTSITGLLDKGASKGALVGMETRLTSQAQCYATVTTSIMARSDGGCGSFGEVPAFSPPPARTANLSKKLLTRPDQAALYRLLGDINPLHIDPQSALRSGFHQAILHGLCTYGIACRALSGMVPHPLKSVAARLSAPVFPGETLRLDIWEQGDSAHFELHSADRKLCVLSHGFAQFG